MIYCLPIKKKKKKKEGEGESQIFERDIPNPSTHGFSFEVSVLDHLSMPACAWLDFL
jgi:hypothetical protein